MPADTRIAALFRGKELLHPTGSTILKAGDALCVIGHEHDLPALGKLFSEAPERTPNLSFFGDFILQGDAQLQDLAMLYSFELGSVDGQQTLAEFMEQKIPGKPVVGDHIDWNDMVWTVAEMDGNNVRKIGVKPMVKHR